MNRPSSPELKRLLDAVDLKIARERLYLQDLEECRSSIIAAYCDGAGIPKHGTLAGNSLLIQLERPTSDVTAKDS